MMMMMIMMILMVLSWGRSRIGVERAVPGTSSNWCSPWPAGWFVCTIHDRGCCRGCSRGCNYCDCRLPSLFELIINFINPRRDGLPKKSFLRFALMHIIVTYLQLPKCSNSSTLVPGYEVQVLPPIQYALLPSLGTCSGA